MHLLFSLSFLSIYCIFYELIYKEMFGLLCKKTSGFYVWRFFMYLDNADKTSAVDVIVRVISFGSTEISKISNMH